METDGVAGGIDDADIDLSDETQDFRFLAAITKKGGGNIPKRGEKDFEPDGTNLQSSTLDDSRDAMFQALSVERMHTGKNRLTATWHPTRRLAKIHTTHGTHFKSMGRADSTGTTYLLPEELIYMVERGSLECFYHEPDDSIDLNVPMSVQAVYAAALESTGGLERYQVYAHLRRYGYIVYRNPKEQYDELFKSVGYQNKRTEYGGLGWRVWGLGIFGALFRGTFLGNQKGDPFAPMVPPGSYRRYREIYDRLLIPRTSPVRLAERGEDEKFRITFQVWKPRPNFRKSAPGPPDFYICVVSTKDTRLPSLVQIEGLLEGIPDEEGLEGAPKGLYQGLKEGKKSVVLAVVDTGVISYMRYSDSRFGDFILDVDPPAKGGKGKNPPKQGQGKGGAGQGKKK
ncbi:tRNA-splicing endonuclease subunit sen54 [Orbilia ellipsospora]|uniref:tRNA-splicing endonuclease subunit sen54 n=1 Tax=Orbilia ellipsospora TaxID=2528407 RepID=A0AAV9XFQ7_9PEZI